eukprot:2037708-Pleurochrysis_carterae.AAC.1
MEPSQPAVVHCGDSCGGAKDKDAGKARAVARQGEAATAKAAKHADFGRSKAALPETCTGNEKDGGIATVASTRSQIRHGPRWTPRQLELDQQKHTHRIRLRR